MALPAINRLAKKNLISLTLKKGASYKTPFFRMVFLPFRGENTQVLVMTSKKKLDNRAVYRNKIRRKFLDIIYLLVEKTTFAHLIVFFPYRDSFEISRDELSVYIQKGFEKIQNKEKPCYTTGTKKFSKKYARNQMALSGRTRSDNSGKRTV